MKKTIALLIALMTRNAIMNARATSRSIIIAMALRSYAFMSFMEMSVAAYAVTLPSLSYTGAAAVTSHPYSSVLVT